MDMVTCSTAAAPLAPAQPSRALRVPARQNATLALCDPPGRNSAASAPALCDPRRMCAGGRAGGRAGGHPVQVGEGVGADDKVAVVYPGVVAVGRPHHARDGRQRRHACAAGAHTAGGVLAERRDHAMMRRTRSRAHGIIPTTLHRAVKPQVQRAPALARRAGAAEPAAHRPHTQTTSGRAAPVAKGHHCRTWATVRPTFKVLLRCHSCSHIPGPAALQCGGKRTEAKARLVGSRRGRRGCHHVRGRRGRHPVPAQVGGRPWLLCMAWPGQQPPGKGWPDCSSQAENARRLRPRTCRGWGWVY